MARTTNFKIEIEIDYSQNRNEIWKWKSNIREKHENIKAKQKLQEGNSVVKPKSRKHEIDNDGGNSIQKQKLQIHIGIETIGNGNKECGNEEQ
jgi:hypothetical protein